MLEESLPLLSLCCAPRERWLEAAQRLGLVGNPVFFCGEDRRHKTRSLSHSHSLVAHVDRRTIAVMLLAPSNFRPARLSPCFQVVYTSRSWPGFHNVHVAQPCCLCFSSLSLFSSVILFVPCLALPCHLSSSPSPYIPTVLHVIVCLLACVCFFVHAFFLFLFLLLTGVKPARRISAVATVLLYSFAVAFPFLHNYVMANIGL